MNEGEPKVKIVRPKTLRQVAEGSDSLKAFGMNLRDWQHEIQRGGVHSRSELLSRMQEAPPKLKDRIEQGEVADAYLAAYAEWLADRAKMDRPAWCADQSRVSFEPWFSTPLRGHLLVVSPGSFRQRNLFTVPEDIFVPRPGRPRVSADTKREKARRRQQAYRRRKKQQETV